MGATTFTVGSGDIVRPYQQGAGSVRIRSFPEFTGQVFVAGDLLIAGGTGAHKQNQVKLAGNAPSANIIGFAIHGASGTEGTAWSGVGGGGMGSRTDSVALAAGAASSLGPGIAGSLGSGVSGGLTKGLVQVYLAHPEALFVGRCGSGQAISNDDIGSQFGLTRDATNLIWRVDNTNTTQKAAQIVGLFDADGDINGRYIFKIVAATNLLFGER